MQFDRKVAAGGKDDVVCEQRNDLLRMLLPLQYLGLEQAKLELPGHAACRVPGREFSARLFRSRARDIQATVQQVQVDAVIKGRWIRLCAGVATRQDQRCKVDQQGNIDG